jgi:hypothetical protein
MSRVVRYVGAAVLCDLKSHIDFNLGRYSHSGFDDMAQADEWGYRTKFSLNLAPLAELQAEGGSAAEVANSLRVLSALPDLTPAAATEARIWTRLSHVECFKFCRDRWLVGRSGDGLRKAIRTHFFGDSRTGARDEHPIGRLWWNGQIARGVSRVAPDLPAEEVLAQLLSRADIRLNTIERPGVVMMPRLTAAIVRCLRSTPLLSSSEDAFRVFMKTLNARGGGQPFEVAAIDDGSLARLVEGCIPVA